MDLPTYDTIPDSLADLAARAGHTAEGVAKILADFHVRAECFSVSRCAIAAWLHTTVPALALGQPEDVEVDPGTTVDGENAGRVIHGRQRMDHYRAIHLLPDAVNSFAIRFDRKEWPDLIEGGAQDHCTRCGAIVANGHSRGCPFG